MNTHDGFLYSHKICYKMTDVEEEKMKNQRLGHTGERIYNGGQTDKNVQNLVIR